MSRFRDFDHHTACAYCGKALECATEVTGRQARAPADGDYSLCAGCGEISVFDAAAPGGQRRPNAQEAWRASIDEEVCRLRVSWAAFQALRMLMREDAGSSEDER